MRFASDSKFTDENSQHQSLAPRRIFNKPGYLRAPALGWSVQCDFVYSKIKNAGI